jgi:hypothetical protein
MGYVRCTSSGRRGKINSVPFDTAELKNLPEAYNELEFTRIVESAHRVPKVGVIRTPPELAGLSEALKA